MLPEAQPDAVTRSSGLSSGSPAPLWSRSDIASADVVTKLVNDIPARHPGGPEPDHVPALISDIDREDSQPCSESPRTSNSATDIAC